MVEKSTSKIKKTNHRKVTKVEEPIQFENDEVKVSDGDNKNPGDKKKQLVIGMVAIVVIAVVVAIAINMIKPGSQRSSVETVVSKNELKDKLNIDIKDPVDGDNVVYGIENDSIAKISYKKKVTDGIEMNFVMRTSSSVEDIEASIGLDVEFAYTPIVMNVVCDDGSEVPVEARVAVDEDTEEMRYMKALWYDNDKYYSMVTDNLVTREDFLQEVNRVIIANHVEF